MAEQNKRGSAAESGHAGGKKARANIGEVKQERQEEEEEEEGEVSQEEETGPLVVALASSMEDPQIDVRIAVGLLHCQACLLPLKPPVFKCEAAHVVCSGCRGCHGQICGRAAVYAHCAELDAIVGTAKVPCVNAPYGCDNYIVYAAVTNHQRACPCAPCSCPEPGCDFTSSQATLLCHFATNHSWPVAEISYGKPCKLAVPPPRRCHVLVGEGDRALFLVWPCAVGAVTAVCVVCVRANGDAAAQFRCKLWAEVSTNNENMVMMTSMVRSSDLSGGFPAAEHHGMFLVVPPELLHEVSGEMPILSIRIDRAGAAAAKSTTPRASDCSDMLLQTSLAPSPSTMQHGEPSGAKKAWVVLPNGQVKREMVKAARAEGAGAGAGEKVGEGAMIAAAEGDAFERVEISMRIDMAVLHCPLCLLPLKPPTYQCAAGHLACSRCHGDAPERQCHACGGDDDGGGGVYARCPALDTFLRAAKILCPNDLFGCRSYVAYYDVGDHQRACPYAPCSCSEPRCDFLGSPPMLLAHLIADHSWPVSKVRYGEALTIHVPESERRHLVVAEEDERVFVLCVGAVGMARAVSVACVRANAAAGPRYRCKLWAHAADDAANGAVDFVHMESEVASSAAPGEVAVDEEAIFLTVPPCLLHPLHDTGTSKEMLLRLSISIGIYLP
ncbi:hypothetical protein E2562_023539 [Oryza meyeriana var. granulata]|nr:hypothetical protein E2562_023539 [Oryza meyeriana var. granulata]